MSEKIEGVSREVCDATEYVCFVTQGPDGPHLSGHWGSYMKIDEEGRTLLFPVGRFQRTEQNLRNNARIQLMVASRKVQGTRSPGQGCVIEGLGEIVLEGKPLDEVRERFPWARGALVVRVQGVATQL
ncbi:MAG TPA: pyridoxamine 5'-phosphate oxidase family protein [Rubrivivax sp.]|nr:pyridoxamine 5'-phosphate oxidase family protein [Rubrivivax sp.]